MSLMTPRRALLAMHDLADSIG
ncbi:hypothetical protein CBM2609_P220013 [Cupriavidus taiwanensis]|nr:hypothetical protein CBM2591_P260014 [Cupriavidus taiwanensis]SOZ02316.1 hypothetical protein CBM2600_P230015 [Cupriavidus taiwanensis]SOZ21413.1 hypothetical protein CBM2604_P220015 [Cupriavidus taiwanensis]SOZ33938.1 hypothetical protein CBM2609_P220013 [Cupriavidus taiwanensis]SOZ50717.1 hypothetical protein CBM2610_P200017 [Cupriavidus taiwanensis]